MIIDPAYSNAMPSGRGEASGEGYTINGLDVGGDSVFLSNGTKIHPINQVLLPASMVTPTPAAAAVAVTDVVSATRTGRIAFVSNHDGNAEICMMNADGSGQKRLTTVTSIAWWSSWGR